MIFIIAYLVIGIILTALLIKPQEDETARQIITDVVVSVVGWPLILYMSIRSMFEEDDE